MDYSSMLRMSYELNTDTFKAGRVYKIKIHKQEVFSRVVEVSLGADDDFPYDINKAYKNLYNIVNEIGIDTICIGASTKFVEFITSTRNVKRDIVKMTIHLTLDDILEAHSNTNKGATPAIEIL